MCGRYIRSPLVRVKTTVEQVTRPGFVSRVANSSGRIIGAGVGKIFNVITGFTSGFQTGMNAERQPKQEEQKQIQQMQRSIYHSQTQEAPQTVVTEELMTE